MLDLKNILKQNKRIALDSMIFIYYFEDHDNYVSRCEMIFDNLDKGKNIGTTSILTYLEIINLPVKIKRDYLVSEYENIIRNYPNLLTQNLNFEILNNTSRLINNYGIHTLDAIQIATAINFGATVFVTNDKMLKKIKDEIRVVCLDEVKK
jgi:predicted nucleic acid-binding protein